MHVSIRSNIYSAFCSISVICSLIYVSKNPPEHTCSTTSWKGNHIKTKATRKRQENRSNSELETGLSVVSHDREIQTSNWRAENLENSRPENKDSMHHAVHVLMHGPRLNSQKLFLAGCGDSREYCMEKIQDGLCARMHVQSKHL